MVYISEWLPNPKGADAEGEWIEIYNSGSTTDISGWKITADGKKFFSLSGSISQGERKVLYREETKISLKNSDGKLALYDSSGKLVQNASFLGSAREAQSANWSESGYFFGNPTPGKTNSEPNSSGMLNIKEYPFGVPINPIGGDADYLTSLFGTALAIAAALMFILKSHEGISHIFFGRD